MRLDSDIFTSTLRFYDFTIKIKRAVVDTYNFIANIMMMIIFIQFYYYYIMYRLYTANGVTIYLLA